MDNWSGERFQRQGKSQGSLFAPCWNTGAASALNIVHSSGYGVASTVGAARALELSARIWGHELIEVVVPVALHRETLCGLAANAR